MTASQWALGAASGTFATMSRVSASMMTMPLFAVDIFHTGVDQIVRGVVLDIMRSHIGGDVDDLLDPARPSTSMTEDLVSLLVLLAVGSGAIGVCHIATAAARIESDFVWLGEKVIDLLEPGVAGGVIEIPGFGRSELLTRTTACSDDVAIDDSFPSVGAYPTDTYASRIQQYPNLGHVPALRSSARRAMANDLGCLAANS